MSGNRCNGVDTPTLFATIDAVKDQPALAKFQFRATNRWVKGTHSRSTDRNVHGAGGEHVTPAQSTFDADHPAVLVGGDTAPTPVEFLLHASPPASRRGIANIAAARGVTLTEVESTVEGDIDLRGILGLSDEVRNGYEQIRVDFTHQGRRAPEKLRQIVEQSQARSAVFDISPTARSERHRGCTRG